MDRKDRFPGYQTHDLGFVYQDQSKDLEDLVKKTVDEYFASTKPTISLVQLVADAEETGYKRGFAAAVLAKSTPIRNTVSAKKKTGVGFLGKNRGLSSLKVGNGDRKHESDTSQGGIVCQTGV